MRAYEYSQVCRQSLHKRDNSLNFFSRQALWSTGRQYAFLPYVGIKLTHKNRCPNHLAVQYHCDMFAQLCRGQIREVLGSGVSKYDSDSRLTSAARVWLCFGNIAGGQRRYWRDPYNAT